MTWATVAQAQLDKSKGAEMKAVIERSKRESEAAIEHNWKEGAKVGREWAVHQARLSHLRKIGEDQLRFGNPESNAMAFL